MKSEICTSLAVVLVGVPTIFAAVKPAMPLAPVITYGLIRDEYGAPLTKASAAALALVRDGDRAGTAYATCAVGESGIAGMNYRLSLEIDSSGGGRSYAVTAGTPMFVKAMRGDIEEALSPVATFTVPAQGTKQRLDYSFGTDADADGLPDDWEEWVLDLAGRDSSSAARAAFKPGDDADGDGMTNLQEYLAGTDPFLATDLLTIESFEVLPGTGRARLTFRTAVDRTYRVLMAESLTDGAWTPVATARAEGDALVYEPYAGNGRRMTVYVDARLAAMLFRVSVN